jgi:hypothetical protein
MPRPRLRIPCADCGGPPRLNWWVLAGEKGLTIACRRCGAETCLYPASQRPQAEAEWIRLNTRPENLPAMLAALRGRPVVVLLRGPVSGSFRGRLDEEEGGVWEITPAEGSVLRFMAAGCRGIDGATILLGRPCV